MKPATKLGRAGKKAVPQELSSAEHSGDRFDLLQVLRGLAALWVVLFHLWTTQAIPTLYTGLPSPLREAIFAYGRGGVAVFFVLSGFVITHSLWGKTVDGRFLATFAVRRSIRLDPAYWVSIGFACLALAILSYTHDREIYGPSTATLLVHFAYLQELIRVEEIQVVYWTLTYEIQFYIITAVGAYIWHRWQAYANVFVRSLAWTLPAAFLISGVVSAFGDQVWMPRGVFLNYWFAFVAGALAYAAGWRRAGASCHVALAVIIVTCLWRAHNTAEVFNTPAALTAAGLYIAARGKFLSIGQSSRALLGLGAVSYSLYLIHVPIIQLSGGVIRRVMGQGVVPEVFGLAAALTICISGAAVFWLIVEAPTHRLARRFGGSSKVAKGAGKSPERPRANAA